MTQMKANGLDFEVESLGDPAGEPLLLIMGLGAQMTRWPQSLIDALAARGFRVIRFDNRDVGLSEKLERAGTPDMDAIVKAVSTGRAPPVAYALCDMAADAVGVLDALNIARAHVVGASMGGMIAQLVAADHPERTLSLTSIMSTTGNPNLPRATPEAMAVINSPSPDPRRDLEGYLAHSVAGGRTIGSPLHPADEAGLRERALADFRRCHYPPGFARHYAAILASPDRRPKLKTITAPTVVIHGADDPLVRVEGGADTAATIPGAELLVIPGMGHDLPPALHGPIADAIAKVAGRARVSVQA